MDSDDYLLNLTVFVDSNGQPEDFLSCLFDEFSNYFEFIFIVFDLH
jgi:hypothetical protein